MAVFAKCFPSGSLVRLSAEFQDAAGDAIDPTVVNVRWKDPNGAETLKTYVTDTEVVLDAPGSYHCDVDAAIPGEWTYRWESTGVGQAAAEHTFTVLESAFVGGSP